VPGPRSPHAPCTRLTKAYVDPRYRDPHGQPQGTYFAHGPIHGIGALQSEPSHARRVVLRLAVTGP